MPSTADSQTGSEVKLKRAVAIWNDSGGVGKTTLTANVADTLAQKGEDVLVIDLDPQHGGLSDHVGFEGAQYHAEFDIMDKLLIESQSLRDVVINDDGLSFDLIPSHNSLENFETKVSNNRGPKESTKLVLRENIIDAGLHTEYDYILMDCRATRGELITNAIAASLNVMIPTVAARKGARSVDGLIRFVDAEQRELRNLNSPYLPDRVKTGIISIVPNLTAKNGQFTTDEETHLKYLLQEHPKQMPSFAIKDITGLSNAWTEQRTLREFADSEEFRELRQNEHELLEQFDVLADAIRHSSISNVDDSHVANIPDHFYPTGDDPEESEVMA